LPGLRVISPGSNAQDLELIETRWKRPETREQRGQRPVARGYDLGAELQHAAFFDLS